MFNLFKKLFSKKPEDRFMLPKLNWPRKKVKFVDAGRSIQFQKRVAHNRRRDEIAKLSRKINYRRAKAA